MDFAEFSFFYRNTSINSEYLELVELEEKFVNEQIEYLRQCQYIYSIFIFVNIQLASEFDHKMSKYVRVNELQAIAKQGNIDDFDFYFDFEVSRFFF